MKPNVSNEFKGQLRRRKLGAGRRKRKGHMSEGKIKGQKTKGKKDDTAQGEMRGKGEKEYEGKDKQSRNCGGGQES